MEDMQGMVGALEGISSNLREEQSSPEKKDDMDGLKVSRKDAEHAFRYFEKLRMNKVAFVKHGLAR